MTNNPYVVYANVDMTNGRKLAPDIISIEGQARPDLTLQRCQLFCSNNQDKCYGVTFNKSTNTCSVNTFNNDTRVPVKIVKTPQSDNLLYVLKSRLPALQNSATNEYTAPNKIQECSPNEPAASQELQPKLCSDKLNVPLNATDATNVIPQQYDYYIGKHTNSQQFGTEDKGSLNLNQCLSACDSNSNCKGVSFSPNGAVSNSDVSSCKLKTSNTTKLVPEILSETSGNYSTYIKHPVPTQELKVNLPVVVSTHECVQEKPDPNRWYDPTNDNSLHYHGNTPNKCIQRCFDKNFPYAGVYGAWCMCGDQARKNRTLEPSTDCRPGNCNSPDAGCGVWNERGMRMFKTGRPL